MADGLEQFLAEHVYSLCHWPFVAVAFVLMTFGQVMKRAVWTKARAMGQGHACDCNNWFWKLGRATLPLHPVVLGGIIGAVWTSPEKHVSGPGAVIYFAAAGALSTWLYDVMRSVAKRYGVRLPEQGMLDENTPTATPLPFPAMSSRDERPTTPYEREGVDAEGPPEN